MALDSTYIFFSVQTHFRSVKFKGLPARDDASNSERTSYHDFEKKYWTSSERFTSATYVFHFWIGSQSEGITFTIQFSQVQLDRSPRNLSLPIEHLFWIRFRQSAEWLSFVLCTSVWLSLCAWILVFSSFFFLLVIFSMLNGNFFVTRQVRRWRKLEIVAVLLSLLSLNACKEMYLRKY